MDDSSSTTSIVSQVQDDKHGGIRLKHFKIVSSVEWHRKGDYLSIVMLNLEQYLFINSRRSLPKEFHSSCMATLVCTQPVLAHLQLWYHRHDTTSCSVYPSYSIGIQKQHATNACDAPSLELHYCVVCMATLLCSFSKPMCLTPIFSCMLSKIVFKKNLVFK